MNQNTPPSHKSFLGWLGAIILVLLILGAAYLATGGRSEVERDETSPLLLPAQDTLSSPLPAALDSPLPVVMDSPLPVPSPPPTASSPPPPTRAASPAAFQLTVLHTNDTWGYLRPCG